MWKTDLKRLCLPLIVLCLALISRPVRAHLGGLLLVRSDPPVNAVLPHSPEVIHLWFEDPVNPRFSGFQLRDVNTRLIDTPSSSISPDDPTQISMMLATALADGLYVITYQAISAVDGHESQGSFAFIVGQVAGGFDTYQDWNERSHPVEWLALNLKMSGLALLAGGLGLRLAVRGTLTQWPQRASQLLWVGVSLAALAEAALLVLRVETLRLPGTTLTDYLLYTRQGMLGLAGLGLAGGMALVMQRSTALSFLLTSAWVLLHSLSSRVLVIPDQYAAAAAYWLHAQAAYLLAGGLVHLMTGWQWRDGLVLIWQAAGRAVGILVLVMGATGLYLAWMRTGSWGALLTTVYGQSLLVKSVVGLVIGAAMILASWVANIPRSVLGGSIVISAFGGLVVIALTGFLLSIAPARDILALRQALPPIPDTETTLQELATVDNLHVQLYLMPGVAGQNRGDLLVFDSGTGARLDDVSKLMLTFHSPETGETLQVTAQSIGDGVYSIAPVALSAAGAWRTEALVSRPDYPDVILQFQPELAEPLDSSIPMLDTTIPVDERVLAAGWTAAMLVAIISLTRHPRWVWWLAAAALFITALLGVGVMLLAAGVACIGYAGLVAGQRARGGPLAPVITGVLLLVAGVLLANVALALLAAALPV